MIVPYAEAGRGAPFIRPALGTEEFDVAEPSDKERSMPVSESALPSQQTHCPVDSSNGVQQARVAPVLLHTAQAQNLVERKLG